MKFISTLEECKSKQIKLIVKNNKLLISDEHGNLTDELKSQLKQYKQDIIAWFSPVNVQQNHLKRAPECETYPLSYSQQRLWFIDKLEQNSSQYHLSYALKVNGELNIAALKCALSRMLDRHQVLRTVFIDKEGVPVQRVLDAVSVPLETQLLDINQSDALKHVIQQETQRAFDLANDPMLRCKILELHNKEKVVVFTMHHIAADGWSMGIFVKEFSQFYQAYSRSESLELTPLPLQFKDFAYWQRHESVGSNLQHDLAYWLEKLAGIPQVHNLALDKPRPAKQRYDAKRLHRMLDANVYNALMKLANCHEATLFMVMQAAFAALIARFSASQDIVIGVPHAGREQPETRGLIGFFINTLVLRSTVNDQMTVNELIAQTKTTVLEAFHHDKLPFEQLIEALNPERTLAYNPVCQIKFVLQNFESSSLELPEVDFTPIEKDGDQVRFDLDLTAKASEKGIYLGWSYKEDLFDETHMKRMVQAFELLLSNMAAQPNAKLCELMLLDNQSKQQLLQWGTGEVAEEGRTQPLIDKFEQQVQQTPSAEAITFIGANAQQISLTYQQLNEKAGKLASVLEESGVEPQERVGVYLQRSVELLIALLAIQKLGATYVMLSESFGTQRLSEVIKDAQIEVILQERSQNLPAVSGVDAIFLDGAALDKNWLHEYTAIKNSVTLSDIAYVLYTSGSTGKPKGVQVTHEGLLDYCLISSQLHYPQNGSLVASAVTFDLSIPGLYVPLLNGGNVCLISEDDEITQLARALKNESLQQRLIRLTPSHLRAVLPLLTGLRSQQAHTFVIGGEKFPVQLAKTLQAHFEQATIYNHYGPTETVVGATCFNVTSYLYDIEHGTEFANLPIGKALPNTCLFVLDATGNLAPIGVPGELCIGTRRIAKGYLQQEALSEQKFVQINTLHNELVYRTGDKVRWLEEGNLEFLGRIDDQVKVRGYRIELGEIEQLLVSHEQISEAVVKVWGEEEDAQLVAYVVASGEPKSAHLLAFLSTRLPEYMLPTSIEFVEAMPLSANGKVNKNALLKPEQKAHMFEPLQTDTERMLADIWSNILGVKDVGRFANFFELGGHSLKATRVVSEIIRLFSKPIAVRALFEHRVLADLAQYIDEFKSADKLQITTQSKSNPLPLSFAQQRLWFIDQLEGASPQYNMSSALKLTGHLDVEALHSAINALITRHEILRTVYRQIDGEPMQIVLAPTKISIEQFDLSALHEHEQFEQVKKHVDAQSQYAFDLAHDMMVKVGLVRLSVQTHVLILTVHHIACDGWSNAIINKELSAFYQSEVEGHQAQLSPLSIQYADYAVWQRQQIGEQGLSQQLDYWKNQLAGIPTVHNLPLDQPRTAQQDFAGEQWVHTLDEHQATKLKAFCQTQGVTLFAFMQTLLSVVVARFSGERDIVIGAPTAGRQQQQVEPLIGFFLNTLVLRTVISDNPSFNVLLKQNQQTILDAFSNDTVPFDMLVDELKPQRSLSYHPIVQILLNVFEKEPYSAESEMASSLRIEPWFQEDKAQLAKADLTLYVRHMGKQLFFSWSYRSALFSKQNIQRLNDCFQYLLAQVMEAPQQGVFDIPLVHEQDALTCYQQSEALSVPASIVPQIWSHAQTQGSKIALRDGRRELSYQQLCQQAEHLGCTLIHRGIKPGDHVAVLMTRRCEWLVAALSILKIGAVYVPISSEFPSDRIAYILNDVGARLVLTEKALVSYLPTDVETFQVTLTSNGTEQVDAQWPDITGNSASHIIYTSGTTGDPKGVIGSHRSLANRIYWMLHAFPFEQGEVTAIVTSSAFIRSVWEMFTPLVAGSTAVLIEREVVLDQNVLSDTLAQHKVSRLVTAPSLARALYHVPKIATKLHAMRYWFLSGEPMYGALANDIAKRFLHVRIVNLYGSTETMSDVSFYEINTKITHTTAPIGKAIANNGLLILDKQCIQPVGVPGEICVYGDNLANGYWQQAELSAEKFFELDNGIRVYRTGDLGRLLPSGDIECLGRADNQIKIRGFRIELGEIESRLARCEWVREAVVLVQGEEEQRYLVAYLVLQDEHSASALEQVKSTLKKSLPQYMLPTHYALLNELPLTANGKINRRALIQSQITNNKLARKPQSETELRLADIWLKVLAVDLVNASDNFFEIGGHSLLATRVVNDINKQLQKQLSVRCIFEHPILSELAAYMDMNDIDDDNTPIIPSEEDKMPLSYSQQRLWFVNKLQENKVQNNQSIVLRCKGALDLSAVEKAINAIVERHAILRTIYDDSADEATQVVLESCKLSPELIDLQGLTDTEQELRLKHTAKQQMQYVFDLYNEPSIRYAVAQCGEDDFVLFITVHHIATDGWSKGILSQELIAFYRLFTLGVPHNLPPLHVQYGDYANWQRRAGDGKVLQQEWQYWQAQLKDLPVSHSLPLDRARPNHQTVTAGRYAQVIEHVLAEKLKGLANEQQVSLFMLLQAALATLISRWSNETDVVIGTPIAGRNRAELEPLIGFFVNNLVLRNQIDHQQSFSDLLAHSKQMVIDAFANQHTPFDMLVERLNPERHMNHAPLFQIVLAMQSNTTPDLTLENIDIETFGKEISTIDVDIHVNISLSEEGIHIRWLYASALFDEQTINRFSKSFLRLLNSIVEAPHQPIATLNILPRDEHQLLAKYRGQFAEQAESQLAHELVEYWALQQPDALAVNFDGELRSYTQLNKEANRLAHFLINQGVKPDMLVAICVERSVEMVVAILAVLKAGGAYLPVDPEYPEERIETMLTEAHVEWVLAQNAVLESISVLSEYQVLPMDTEFAEALLSGMSDENISKQDIGLTSQHLAYCIFTSGSTGKPKGVLLSHKGLNNLHINQKRYYPTDHQSRVMAFASLSFDGATFEWLWALGNGASLHICDQQQRLSALHLSEFLLANRITHGAIPPALLMHVPYECNYQLQDLIVAGEACDQKLAWQWAKKYRVSNSYGPSEGTVAATHAYINANENIVLGCALDGVVVDVVSDAGEQQPIGVVGEIRIGGAGLARGYLDDALTAERFRIHTDGERYYYTGDLAKRNSKGELEFIGRKDSQVKLRGFRVELGEVEQVLAMHADVSKGVVVVDTSSGNMQLAAYVKLARPLEVVESAAILQWRKHMLKHVPNYMVPASFTVVDDFALTSNGKVDKAKLPLPKHQALDDYIAPQTATEITLAALWSNMLNIDEVSANADFFELGGHSLLATQMMSHIAHSLNKEVPIRAIFEHSRLNAFANYVDGLGKVCFSAIGQVDRNESIPLSFSQQRLWFIYQLEGASAQYNMQVALKFSGEFDVDVLQRVFNSLMQRHEILRTTYTNLQGQGIQVIHAQRSANIKQTDLSALSANDANDALLRLIKEDANTAFDLTKDAMLRCILVNLPSDESALILSTHHIASDGWSMNVLAKEFMSLYKNHSEQKPSTLPPLPIQYADYAYWQREVLGNETLQADLAYWKGKLTGLPTVHGVPLDNSRLARQQFQGAHIVRILDAKKVAALHQLANEQGVSQFMLLQSVLNVVYAHWSGDTDIVLGTPIAGRQHKDLEPLIGFFVNSLVLRNDLSQNPSFVTLLEQVKNTTLDAFAHQSLPFEALVEELKPERSLAYTPLYQLSFTYHSHEMSQVEIDNVEVSRIERQSQQARYDIEVHMRENQDGLYVRWVYATSLFEQQTIERIAQSFEMAVDAFINAPQLPVLNADITPVKDLTQIAQWNHNPLELPDSFAHEVFERFAEQNPDALAVLADDVTMSYRELNSAANQVARYLIEQGVVANTIVGICMQRRVEMLIGLLAVLKAGGAYLPLDPNYPEQRLQNMVEDSQIEIVLTQTEVLETLPFLSELTVLPLDKEFRDVLFSDLSDSNVTRAERLLTIQDLAYMVYTSGSTGKPKGVMLTHQGLVNLMVEQQRSFAISSHCRVLQFSSFSFDAATWDWLLALTNGAALYLCDQDVRLSAQDLARYLQKHEITHALIPPAMLAQLPVQQSYALQVLVVGGEACDPQLAWQWTDICKVVNAYGPSESTVVTTFSEVKAQQPLTLGRATANNIVAVVNSFFKPVPIGVPGELLIGGQSLARGYWQQDALSAERFIIDEQTGKKLYRSGDRVRWLASGELEYLGRNDDQIKIRGFRVELGEVEHRLKLQPKVANAVVIAHTSSAQQRLIAYVVPEQVVDLTTMDQAEFIAQLRSDVKDSLPDFMVPSVFMLIAQVPITANGKVDKRSLPEPQYQADSNFLAAKTDCESRIVALVAQLLELDVNVISTTANFFDLGGHSILAIKLVSKVNELYGVNISIRHLFLHNTLGKLAAYIEQGASKLSGHSRSLVPLNSASAKYEVVCVPAAGLLPMSYQALGHALNQKIRLLAFEPQGLSDGQALHVNFDEVVSSYVDELLSQEPREHYVIAGHSFGGAIAFEMAVALEKLGKSVELILFDSLIYLPDVVRGTQSAAKYVQRIAGTITNDQDSNESEDAFEQLYQQQLSDLTQTDKAQGYDFVQSLLSLVRAQFNMYNAYLPHQKFNGKVSLIRAKEGILAKLPQSEIAQHLSVCVSQHVDIADVSGGHLTMLTAQFVESIAAHVEQMITTYAQANQIKNK